MEAPPFSSESQFPYELRVRITEEMRQAIKATALERQTSSGSIVRYALLQWLHAQAKRAAS